jgi:hypothetical protein
MMSDVQGFANASASYKQVTYSKHLTKKRGRSFNRKERRNSCTVNRIMRDSLAASFASKEFRKEMKQFEKTVEGAAGRGIHDIPVPEFLTTLHETAKLAEGNLKMAQISYDAMSKYPPLS